MQLPLFQIILEKYSKLCVKVPSAYLYGKFTLWQFCDGLAIAGHGLYHKQCDFLSLQIYINIVISVLFLRIIAIFDP